MMMEKELPKTVMGRDEDTLESASDNSKSVINSVQQHGVSNQNRKRKNAGGTVQTFVDNNVSSLKKISLLLNEIKCSSN